MTHPILKRRLRGQVLAALLLGAAALALPRVAAAEALIFQTPEAAVSALIKALDDANRDELIAIFGPESEDVILTGNDAEDREVWSEFLQNQRTLSRILVDGDSATLEVGRSLWPFPIPLVRDHGGLAVRRRGWPRRGAAAPHRPERARRDRPDGAAMSGAGRLPRLRSGRRRPADLRCRRAEQRPAPGTGSTGRRSPVRRRARSATSWRGPPRTATASVTRTSRRIPISDITTAS